MARKSTQQHPTSINFSIDPACDHLFKWLRPALLILVLTFSFTGFAQYNVTGIYTDYQGGWASSSTALNPVKPNNSHNLIGFSWNGLTFSTGVNDAALASLAPGAINKDFRAFPIDGVSTASNPLFGLGQLYDGVNNGASNPPPFPAPNTSATLASTLTDGIKGLNIGTGIANIAAGDLRFNLSSIGISASAISDNVPDVLVTQIAEPGSSAYDLIYFVDINGNTVGTQLSIVQSGILKVGTWTADFYSLNGSISITNTDKDYRLWAADLSSFGITADNVGSAVALIYRLNGQSDVAFVAFNVPSISVATRLAVSTQPSSTVASACCGTISSSTLAQSPVVQVQDGSGNNILQAGIPVTASILSGPAGAGPLQGTVTSTTDAQGRATFSALRLPCEAGNYVLQFSSSSLDPASASVITVTAAQNFYVRSGSTGNLSNTASWSSAADGTGDAPSNFQAGQVFNLSNTAGDVSFASGADWSLNAKLAIPSGATLTITGTTTTSLFCDVDHRGTIQSSNGRLSLLGSSVQQLDGNTTVQNMTFNNAAGVTLNGNTTINSIATITNGVVKVNGIKLSVGAGFSRTGGSIDASAVNSTVALGGTGPFPIATNIFSTTVNNLEAAVTGGIVLGSNITVNRLTLINGLVNVQGFKLTATSITGGSATSYVRTAGSGTLAMNVPAGASRLFPIGRTGYAPVTITNNNAAADVFNAGVLDDVYENGASGTALTQARIKRTWNITKTNTNTGSGFGMAFQWNAGDNTGVTLPALYQYSGGWIKQTTGTSNYTAPVNYSYNGYAGSATSFALIDNAVTLPVTWASFTAQKSGKAVRLEWKTATENNTRSFEIFRSTDGQSWKQLGQQEAAGNSDIIRTYSFDDEAPSTGLNYYRIRQTDIDGRSAYSEIASVLFAEDAAFRVLGNPITGRQLRVNSPGDTNLELLDATGRSVLVHRINTGITTIDLGSIAPGTYTVRAMGTSIRIIVKN